LGERSEHFERRYVGKGGGQGLYGGAAVVVELEEKKGRREEGKKGRREEGKKGRREEGKKKE
jgi:hypothetical protein